MTFIKVVLIPSLAIRIALFVAWAHARSSIKAIKEDLVWFASHAPDLRLLLGATMLNGRATFELITTACVPSYETSPKIQLQMS